MDITEDQFEKVKGSDNGISKNIEIPVDGMLGLLAFGDIGLVAWRKARQRSLDKKDAEQKFESFDSLKNRISG